MAERKRKAQEVFLPLVYKPGDLGEVDRRAQQSVDVSAAADALWAGRDFREPRIRASTLLVLTPTEREKRCLSAGERSERKAPWHVGLNRAAQPAGLDRPT